MANQDDSLKDYNCQASTPPLMESLACISWMPQPATQPAFLATAAWDGELRIFGVEQHSFGAQLVQKLTMPLPSPALGLCWNGQNNGLFAGCADGTLRAIDLSTGQTADIGRHKGPIRNVFFISGHNILLSTSYDKYINFWQPGNSAPINSMQLQHKIYVADFMDPVFAAGLSEDKVLLFDINSMNKMAILDSPLGKGSTVQSIAVNTAHDTLGVGSADGRANLSQIKQSAGELKLVRMVLT